MTHISNEKRKNLSLGISDFRILTSTVHLFGANQTSLTLFDTTILLAGADLMSVSSLSPKKTTQTSDPTQTAA